MDPSAQYGSVFDPNAFVGALTDTGVLTVNTDTVFAQGAAKARADALW